MTNKVLNVFPALSRPWFVRMCGIDLKQFLYDACPFGGEKRVQHLMVLETFLYIVRDNLGRWVIAVPHLCSHSKLYPVLTRLEGLQSDIINISFISRSCYGSLRLRSSFPGNNVKQEANISIKNGKKCQCQSC